MKKSSAKKPGKPELTFAEIQFYDQLIRAEMNKKMSDLRMLSDFSAMVRNTGKGRRRGNLVADVARVLKTRIFSREVNPEISSMDPEYQTRADELEIVAESICKVAEIKEKVYDAVTNAMWNGVGFVFVSHPMDPLCMDPSKTKLLDRAAGNPMPKLEDSWEEAGEFDQAFVTDPSAIPIEDLLTQDIVSEEDEEPEPVFSMDNGHPYLESVDPRFVIYNSAASRIEECDWIARIRPMTRNEIKYVIGRDITSSMNANQYSEAIREVYGIDTGLYQDMMLVIEVWISRNRMSPEKSDWYLSYVYGDAENTVIYNKPNPHQGFVPFVSITLDRTKKFGDDSLTKEIAPFADTYDLGIQKVMRDIKRSLNQKWLVSNGAGLDKKDADRLKNDSYTGEINVKDPSQVVSFKELDLNPNVLYTLSYFKKLAQGSHGISDLDNGNAIKDITARQTLSLNEATSLNIDGIKSQVNESFKILLLKLMFLAGKYTYMSAGRKYNLGNNIVSVAPGQYDYTTSFIYDVQIRDTADVAPEKFLVFNQLIRMVSQDPMLRQSFNTEQLARVLVSVLKLNPKILAVRSGENENPMPGIDGSTGSVLPFNQGAGALTHPERNIGDRGISVSNAVAGQANVGKRS